MARVLPEAWCLSHKAWGHLPACPFQGGPTPSVPTEPCKQRRVPLSHTHTQPAASKASAVKSACRMRIQSQTALHAPALAKSVTFTRRAVPWPPQSGSLEDTGLGPKPDLRGPYLRPPPPTLDQHRTSPHPTPATSGLLHKPFPQPRKLCPSLVAPALPSTPSQKCHLLSAAPPRRALTPAPAPHSTP